MTTDTVDTKQAESTLDMRLIPGDENNTPLPYPEEDMISHEEFKRIFEQKLYERLGLKINLRPSE
jgi:hypothetical protein